MKTAHESIILAGFLPGKKAGQWVRGDLRIIERQTPCCTGIVTPEPVGIPDRNPGAYEYGSYASYDLLRGNSRVAGSTSAEEIVAAANQIRA